MPHKESEFCDLTGPGRLKSMLSRQLSEGMLQLPCRLRG